MKPVWFCVVLVVAGVGCSSTPETSEQEAPPAEPPTTTSLPGASLRPVSDAGPGNFVLPSKNIACLIQAREARCDISEHTWQPPPKPPDCDLDWGGALVVESGRQGTLVCVSDSVFGGADPLPTLPYGEEARRGAMLCESAEEGVTCKDEDSGHGFFLSRQRYEAY